MNNNLQVCQQSDPVNIMHYQYSSWIPLNRITNRDEEMESQDITNFHPLAAALGEQRLLKNLQKEKGTLLLIQCNWLQPSWAQSKKKKHVVMYTTVFGKKSHVLHLSQSLESLVFMSPSAHFTLSHEMNVVDTVCQLRVLVNWNHVISIVALHLPWT